MKSRAFVAGLAPANAKITGGFASSGQVRPDDLADQVFKTAASGAWLACYMIRRFGWPNRGSDDHKELCSWTLTTPMPGLFLAVSPYLGDSNLHFGVRFDDRVGQMIRRDPGRDSYLRRLHKSVLKWWDSEGSSLYVLGTGKKEGDVDELVHAYASKGDEVLGLWRRKPAHHRRGDGLGSARNNSLVTYWLWEFIKQKHPKANIPKGMTARERAWNCTAGHKQICTAIRATLRDLRRPVMVRDLGLSPFGNVERDPAAIRLSAGLEPADYFAGAGYTPEAWQAKLRADRDAQAKRPAKSVPPARGAVNLRRSISAPT